MTSTEEHLAWLREQIAQDEVLMAVVRQQYCTTPKQQMTDITARAGVPMVLPTLEALVAVLEARG